MLGIFICQFVSCADCEKDISYNTLPKEGAVKIDTIYVKWGTYAHTAANKRTGETLLFNESDFPVQPKVGDSLVKRKGEAEYTLYTQDSIYVQRFDCRKERGIVVSREKRN